MGFKKYKPGSEVGITDLLLHAVSVYDLAGQIAARNNDVEALLAVGDRLNDASDRLITLALKSDGEGEDKNVRADTTRRKEFGFSPETDNSIRGSQSS